MNLLMSSLLNWKINIYIHAVKRSLKCSGRLKRNFIEHLKGSIASFVNEYPNCTMDDILAFSGPPETLAQEFMETLGEAEICEAQKSLRMRKIVGVALTICAAVLFAGVLYLLYTLISHSTVALFEVALTSMPE